MSYEDWIISGVFIFLAIRYWRKKSKKTFSLGESMDVLYVLGAELKSLGDSLYSTLNAGEAFNDSTLKGVKFEPLARHYISMLQLRALANIVREKGYIKGEQNSMHFLEGTYTILTDNLPAFFHSELEKLPFALAQSPKMTMDLWAKSMANTASSREHLNELLGGLMSIAAIIIIEAQVKACQAFGDSKGAQALINSVK